MNDVFWTSTMSAWSLGLAGLLVALTVWFSIKLLRKNGYSPVLVGVEVLRLLAVLMVAAVILRVERVEMVNVAKEPEVAVLYDVSGSMATKDVVGGEAELVSRKEWMDSQLTGEFWKPLEAKYRVSRSAFPEAAPDEATDINKALEDALARKAGLRAILLLSDGDWNFGVSPVAAATRLRMHGTRVFCVGVGSEQFLPDLELQDVTAPAYALAEEHLAIPFVIQSRLSREVRTEVIVRSAGEDAVRKSVVIPPHGLVRDSVIVVPQVKGERTFIVSVPVEDEEWLKDNNEKRFEVSVKREQLKVLVVESRPRWEYRFLRNALMRDPGIDCNVLLLHQGIERAKGKGYIQAFPATRSEISSYDVVFLGDVGIEPGVLEEGHAEMLKGLVEQQGSGLVFLPGIMGRQWSFKGSVLEEMMPVTSDERKMKGYGSDIESTLILTERGRGHRLTMLESDPGLNDALWRTLPGFYWYAPVVRAKSGVEVLGVHSQARTASGRVPLLVTRQYGNGKILYMATDSAWRWRRGVEDKYHYKFWGQVVRWMAHQRHLAHGDGVRIAFTPEAPAVGEKVYLHVTLMDKTGYPLQTGVVRASARAPDGTTERLELMAEEGGWGVFTGQFTPTRPGEYSVDVACDAEGRRASARVVAEKVKLERIGRPVKAGLLKEIAAITGGKYGGVKDLEAMIREIGVMPEAEPMEKRFRLWCHPLWGGLVILLLGLHWVSRKLIGMI